MLWKTRTLQIQGDFWLPYGTWDYSHSYVFFYYNTYAFDKFWLPGGLISCLVHFIIYSAFCHLYQAFRIASNSVWDVVFGQTISFGIADAILYTECCLVYNQYVNIFPGLVTAMLQIAGTIFILSMVKRYLISHITPKKTLIYFIWKKSKWSTGGTIRKPFIRKI